MARANGRDRGIVFKKNQWWVRLHIRGAEKWFRCDTKTQARLLYGRLKSEARDNTYFPERYKPQIQISLRALLQDFMAGCTSAGILNEKRYARRFSLWMGARPIREISTEELRKLQFRLRGKMKPSRDGQPMRQWADSTINRHFGFLRRALMVATKDGRLGRNPVSGLKFFPESNATRFFDDEELGHLQGVMEPEDWKLVAFAIETGLRRTEQFTLLWKYVDLEAGVLTIPLPKGGRTRHVPLSENAKALLRSFPSFFDSAWVFPGIRKKDQSMDSRAFMRRAFKPALRKAGIRGACWHTLRHTAASRRVMAGVDLVAVKEFMGHRDIETTLRYAHLSPQHLRAAVNKGSLTGTGTKTGTGVSREGGDLSQPVDLLVRLTGFEPVALSSGG
jgi:integrase